MPYNFKDQLYQVLNILPRSSKEEELEENKENVKGGRVETTLLKGAEKFEGAEITWITVFEPTNASIFFQSRSNL